jgi:hypothetical protein
MELNFVNYTFPQDRMVMCKPVNDVQFTFSTDEWEDFHAAMDEGIYMQEVYSLMEGEID